MSDAAAEPEMVEDPFAIAEAVEDPFAINDADDGNNDKEEDTRPAGGTRADGSVVTVEPPKSNIRGQGFKGGHRKLTPGHAAAKAVKGTGLAALAMSKSEAQANKPKKISTNMDDIDRMLESDAVEMLNMKRDISTAQKDEVTKGMLRVSDLKREYDVLHSNNEAKEKSIQKYGVQIKTLEGLSAEVEKSGSAGQARIDSFNKAITDTAELVLAEQRTQKMLNHMASRLEQEISECRIEASKTTFKIDHVMHEMSGVDSTLKLSRLELNEQERTLHSLMNTLKSRREERTEKISLLHSIVQTGEQSMARLQQASLFEASTSSSQQGRRPGSHSARTRVGGSSLGSRARRPSGPQSVGVLEDNPDAFGLGIDDDALPAYMNSIGTLTAARLKPDQVKEMIERYKTRDGRLERLEQIARELQEQISVQRCRAGELSEQMLRADARHEQLSSNRQVYQEVDMKDAALAAARKEHDDCKEREHRLRHCIEAIKQAVPRFLSKITKSVHNVVTDEQLPDAVNKLEDEIAKLIKSIDTAMLKDATSDDLTAMQTQSQTASDSHGENSSEVARLQKLPGFKRLKKQLFINLMSARPDNSNVNVRVDAIEVQKHNDTELGHFSDFVPLMSKGGSKNAASTNSLGTGIASELSSQGKGPGKGKGPGHANVALDRDTVKKISKLVIERDGKNAPKHTDEYKRPKPKYKPVFIQIK